MTTQVKYGHKKKSLSEKDEAPGRFETDSGIRIEPEYGPFDQQHETRIGSGGKYPFTRGIHETMYRSRFWTMRQYAGFATAEESNRRYRFLLEQGTTGLSVAFDLPTQIGYDSDADLAEGEVGKVGVAIDSLEDMEVLFDGIPLEKISTSMTINATASTLLALYVAVARKQGADISKLTGTVQNDILKEYIARGTYIYPPGPSMRIITDMFQYCAAEVPKWNTISISGYHIREAGSTAVQELAFTFSNAIAYVQAAISAGLDIDRFGSRLSFFFNAHNNFFEEIAKFRAARRIWAHIMRNRFQAKNPKSWLCRFHTQTGGSTLTAQQPLNNIVRVTLQGLAAVMGGTQSLHTNSFDEALALPTEESVGVALKTQQIMAHESGVAATVDPLGGSYFVETLTNKIEEGVNVYLDKIEAFGGSIKAIENGFFQKEIGESSYRYQKAVEKGEKVIVGLNRFQTETSHHPDLLRVNESVRECQMQKLVALKQRRDQEAVRLALDRLIQGAKGTENLMPLILEAVESLATLGEVADVLRGVFGEYRG